MQTGSEIRPNLEWDILDSTCCIKGVLDSTCCIKGVLDSIPAVGGPRGTRGESGTGRGKEEGGREGRKEGRNEGSRGVGAE